MFYNNFSEMDPSSVSWTTYELDRYINFITMLKARIIPCLMDESDDFAFFFSSTPSMAIECFVNGDSHLHPTIINWTK